LVRLYGGYLGSSTILHRLGCISCALLHAVASQDVNNSQKVDFHLWTLYKHSRPDEINEDQYYILKVGFQYNLRKLTSECPTVLDFAAAGNAEGGGGLVAIIRILHVKFQSNHQPTLSFLQGRCILCHPTNSVKALG